MLMRCDLDRKLKLGQLLGIIRYRIHRDIRRDSAKRSRGKFLRNIGKRSRWGLLHDVLVHPEDADSAETGSVGIFTSIHDLGLDQSVKLFFRREMGDVELSDVRMA